LTCTGIAGSNRTLGVPPVARLGRPDNSVTIASSTALAIAKE
jgi:hypothetical protein